MKLLKNILLFPFAFVFGIITTIRNAMYNWGILKVQEFSVPIISVGNLTVGGTGKTPHTEYLVSLFKDNYKIAVLSRGYKRRTSGFVLADGNSSAKTIGDEPFQIKSKFSDIMVAVDEKRCHGINKLMEPENAPDIIILDDAYQHRQVKPGLSILLTSYDNLFVDDYMLPMGRLRESKKNKNRADIVIVTKCPETAKPIDFLLVKKKLNLVAHQRLYFSAYEYDNIKPVFQGNKQSKLHDFSAIMLLTGIVSPQPLKEHLRGYVADIVSLAYPDHHNFTKKDIQHIADTFYNIKTPKKAIVVTEKDAARLIGMDLPKDLKKSIYSIGIRVTILQEKEKEFNLQLVDYVRKNKRNRSVFASKG